MITWTTSPGSSPPWRPGRRQFYQFGIGWRSWPRSGPTAPAVHPVCPVISDAGLHLLIVADPSGRTCVGTAATRCDSENLPAAPPGR